MAHVPFPLPLPCPSSFSQFPSHKNICWFPSWTPASSNSLPSPWSFPSLLSLPPHTAWPSPLLTTADVAPLQHPLPSCPLWDPEGVDILAFRHWQTLDAAQLYPILSREHLPTAPTTPSSFTIVLEIAAVSNGRLWRETSLMRFFFTTTWKWLQVALGFWRCLQAPEETPASFLRCLGSWLQGCFIKQQKIFGQEKSKQKLTFSRQVGARTILLFGDAPLRKTVWPTPAPFRTFRRSFYHTSSTQ